MKKQLENVMDIEIALSEFYKALNAMFIGNIAPMIAIWSHSDDVTYLGPQGGILVGWKQVFNAWSEQAALKLNGKIEARDLHIIKVGDIGIVQNYEVGTNIIHGKTEKINIRATNIFRKEDGKWKLISHQTDLLSSMKNT